MNFIRWARDLGDTAAKASSIPLSISGRCSATAISRRILAIRAVRPIDLTLAHKSGEELDMGTPFDSSGRNHGPPIQRNACPARNRMLLATTLRRHGFHGYDKEWWHFTLMHEPFPETYFDFLVN